MIIVNGVCYFKERGDDKEMGNNKVIFILYFAFVNILFASVVISVIYSEKLLQYLNEKYLPEVIIYPQFDMDTGKATNKDEVTVWFESDFYPWYGVGAMNIYYLMKSVGVFFHIFALLLYLPILLCNRKNIAIIYWVVLAFEITLCFYFIAGLID